MTAYLAKTTAHAAATTDTWLQRKCACGRATGPLADECADCGQQRRLGLPRRITLGDRSDALEQAADRAAHAVMHDAPVMPSPAAPANALRRNNDGSQAADSQPQHATTDGAEAPAGVARVLAQTGEPVPATRRRFFESRFGCDFGHVRIHRDAAAAASARAVDAQAYTVGHHIVFDRDRYDPDGPGRALLAHELAHVLQQGGTNDALPISARLQRAPAGPPPGGVPGVPGGGAVPTLPIPGQRPRQSGPKRAAGSLVCPSCSCTTDEESRIDAARKQAQASLAHAASALGAPDAAVTDSFERTFGNGSATPDNLAETQKRYEKAARFLGSSSVQAAGGGANIHCDDDNTHTTTCGDGATAHYDRGNIIICGANEAMAQMLAPPMVEAVTKLQEGTGDEKERTTVVDPDKTRAKQQASDARYGTRLTAVLAHEAIHHVIQPSVVDVYREERLAAFLGGDSKGIGVDLSPLALQNPDSFVKFAFARFVAGGQSDRLPGADEATATSERLSGKLYVRPIKGRKRAQLAVALAGEALTQAGERINELHEHVQSVQGGSGGPSRWGLFRSDLKDVAEALSNSGHEPDLAQPDAKAEARLEVLGKAFTHLTEQIKDQRIVLGRRFAFDTARRIEVPIPDWKAFRAQSPVAQMRQVLDHIINTEPEIAHLSGVVTRLAAEGGGMGKL
jgi:hypothetical protein